MNAKISEIFQSIQGEGKYLGVRQVFIRFFGCELNCRWCDTVYARDLRAGGFTEMDVDEIMGRVALIWGGCHSISLTGGEPLLQVDFLKELLPQLKKARQRIYLETNGIKAKALQEIVNDIDIIAADIKLPSSTQGPPFWKEHAEFLRLARQQDLFVKTVITADTHIEDIRRAVAIVAEVDPAVTLILQPESGDCNEDVFDKCRFFQKSCLQTLADVRIVPQIHKILGLR